MSRTVSSCHMHLIRRPRPLPLAVFAATILLAGPSILWAQAQAPWLIMDGPAPGYVEVAHAAALNPENITVEAWLYLMTGLTYTGGGCPTVVGKAYTETYWLGVCGNRLRFYSHGSGSNRDSSGQVPIGEWAHVAVTYDGSFLRFYINGVLDSEFTHSLGPMPSNTQPLRIGSSVDFDVRPHGAIDEVRLWSVARSEADIASTMNSAITSPTSGLVAAWNLDGDGTDSVGGFDGSSVGETVFGDTLPEPNECIREYFLPAAAHAGGDLGTQWATDMSIYNNSGTTASVDLFLLPRGRINSDPVHVSFSIDPGASLALPDVILERFGESSMAAALRICSDMNLLIDSRTYNAPSKAVGSTFGQGVPGEDASTATTSSRRLIGLYENDQFRTNLGFVNAGATPADVTVDFYTQDGTWLGTKPYRLPPYGHIQRNKVFTEITEDDIENGTILVRSSGSPIIAYASVVDNGTGDGTYKRAR